MERMAESVQGLAIAKRTADGIHKASIRRIGGTIRKSIRRLCLHM